MKKYGLSVLAGLILAVGAYASVVFGYELTGEYWSSGQVDRLTYNNSADGDEYDAWLDGASDWNNTGTEVFLSPRASSGSPIETYDIYDSGTDNDGYASWSYGSDNYIDNATAYLNEYYTQNYSSNEIRSVAGHEFGHILGLSHESGAVLMNGSTGARYGTYGVYTPQTDDVNGVESIY